MNTAASVNRLVQLKDVDEEMAKLIRAIWKAESRQAISDVYVDLYEVERAFHRDPGIRHIKRLCIDQIMQTCGVEYLGLHKPSGQSFYYCNVGDGYAGTVLFIGGRLEVGCWADYVERNTILERQ